LTLADARQLLREEREAPKPCPDLLAAMREKIGQEIARKWVRRLGWGFHPDTRGADYSPALPSAQVEEYESDMGELAECGDQYAFSCDAMDWESKGGRSLDPQD
jgi:hypothetical protein